MLSDTKINVFDSQEAKAFEKQKEILAMTKLTNAFLVEDIQQFEQIVFSSQQQWDSFMKHNIQTLLNTIRSKILYKLIQPYEKITFHSLSLQLNQLSVQEIENLLTILILDQKIDGKIDQVNQILVINQSNQKQQKKTLEKKNKQETTKFLFAMEKWCLEIEKVHTKIVEKIHLI
jgi:COP9 signalosome complex subunit 2